MNSAIVAHKNILPYHNHEINHSHILQALNVNQSFKLNISLENLTLISLSAKDNIEYTANIFIEYVPNNLLLEIFSLKNYIEAFKSSSTYLEQVIDIIYKDIQQTIKPNTLKVTLKRNCKADFPLL
ncbi:hypothetical protein [Piscirickettsia salmonis]|uniref:hypothetical protein n=1 Tax=Piscirickettsia salmonis TaxID=1238 RepID=UPI001013D3EB|nr:hypothetical protein [Piscirickettsia salmonis]